MKMRNRIFLVIALFASISAGLRAQEPLSFRNQSLGGVVNDRLDLIYDPIQLRFVDSLMLYTNLSNLTSSNEELFSNQSDNEYLIGLSDKDPFLANHWISALVRFRDHKNPGYVALSSALNGFSDMSGAGYLKSDYSAFADLTGDRLYDVSRRITQDVDSYQLWNGSSVVLNNTFLVNDFTLGVKLSLGSSKSQDNDARYSIGNGRGILTPVMWGSPSFHRSFSERDIKTYKVSSEWSQAGTFLSSVEQTGTRVDASVMRPWRGFEVRGDLLVYSINERTTYSAAYAGMYGNYNINLANARDTYQEAQTRETEELRDGSGYGVAAGLRYIFAAQGKDRTNQGFADVTAGATWETYDYTADDATGSQSADEQNLMGFSNYQHAYANNMQERHAGPGTTSIYYLNGRLNIPLRNGILVGLGAMLSSSSKVIDAKYEKRLSSTGAFTILDNVTDAQDYTYASASFLAGDEHTEIVNRALRLPVGLEYRFTDSKAWALRFGAVFEYYTSDANTALQITSSQPMVTTKKDGAGATTVTSDNYSYTSTSSHTYMKYTQTSYMHGLGYNPTDNLQIDLLGFFSVDGRPTLLEYLKALRLSFVLQL